jgi:hypothetical protein
LVGEFQYEGVVLAVVVLMLNALNCASSFIGALSTTRLPEAPPLLVW